ncbi:MAG: P-II family nitrogen regulator [Chloroflexi bacterium]|nr:P-II family nitrogen regulator [Chloroflexota bacterium]
MKLILAVIQPFRLDEVVLSCGEIADFPGMTVVRVRGFGRERFAAPARTPEEEMTDFKDKVQVEIIAPDEQVDKIARTLHRAAHTGRPGDGKIFVLTLEGLVDIRESP